MVADFKRRLWISLIVTAPVLTLSPTSPNWLGLRETLSVVGDSYLLLGLSTFVYV